MQIINKKHICSFCGQSEPEIGTDDVIIAEQMYSELKCCRVCVAIWRRAIYLQSQLDSTLVDMPEKMQRAFKKEIKDERIKLTA